MEAEVLGTVASEQAVATSEAFRVGPFDDPDRYEIGEPVEAGAEGILYRGKLVTPTSRLSLSVAVKALQPAYSARIDQWAARWRDQVELLRSLQIPGLVGVREGFVGPLPHREGAETGGRNLYLVMNWVEGEALDHWVLRHRGLDVRNALKLLLPVAVAVDTMHGGQLTGSVPVVHRDIKPANILIGKNGSVLVDFGLTKGLSIGHPVGRAGTPGYIAPEVLAGGGYTPAADRYAFGATVFFLLTGRHPPTGATPADLRNLMEASSSGAGTDTVVSELVERVLDMLDPDPDRRPAALANWIAQLRQSSLDDESLTVRLAPPAPARPRRGRAASKASMVAGAAANGGGTASETAPVGTAAASRGAAAMAGAFSRDADGGAVGSGPGGASTIDLLSPVLDGRLGRQAASMGASDVEASPLVNTAPRRGGAHRAPRGPLHARRQRQIARRSALAVVLTGALILGVSDTGAIARASRRSSVVSTFSSSGGGSTGGSSAEVSTVPGSPAPAGGGTIQAPASVGGSPRDGTKGPAKSGGATSPSTPPSVANACAGSFDPTCGAFQWSAQPNNKALTVAFGYTPQHPVAGQEITFRIVVDDPDDHPVQLTGFYFGDSAPATTVPTVGVPPSCRSPHGTWQLPAPAGSGHLESQVQHSYANPGSYQVHFTAVSGSAWMGCGPPDPYASSGDSVAQTVTVDPQPPQQTTTTSTTADTAPPPTTTTTVTNTFTT